MVLTLRPYGPEDLDLLRALDVPEMKAHLGGPEGEQATLTRHERYVRRLPGTHVMVAVLDGVTAGSVLCWDSEWRGEPIKEAGWSVLPSFQGRGVATQAVRLLAPIARADEVAAMHAFPATDNGPSNAVCRKAGFALLGPARVEFPKGSWIDVNDWRLDLAC